MSQARFMVRTSARDQLHGDALHGADLQLSEREFEKGTWRSKQYCAAIAFGATRVLTHCRFQTNGTTLVTNAQHPTSAPDAKAEVRRAVASLKENAPDAGSTTSDLSIDEELNLHSIGWEPVQLVSGLSVFSTPAGLWNWGQGEIVAAGEAHEQAFKYAIKRIHGEAPWPRSRCRGRAR